MQPDRRVPAQRAADDPTAPLAPDRIVWLAPEAALARLAEDDIRLEGQFVHGSNDTFLVTLAGRDGGPDLHAVYKPRRGEQPLWDFPPATLAQREAAAHALSEALGWGLVPPTVLRRGPAGPGMLQLFVPHDPVVHFLTLDDPDPTVVCRLAVFDVVANNADRKSGHVLRDPTGRLWAIDHGLTFNTAPKLRTVIWDAAGAKLPDAVAADLARVADDLADRRGDLRRALAALLTTAEIGATVHRAKALLRTGRLPEPDPNVRYLPWPPV